MIQYQFSVADQPTGPGKGIVLTLNSTVLFVLAYLLVHAAHQLATVLTARAAGIPGQLFPGHITFKIYDYQWQAADVTSVYSAGPLTGLLLAVVAFGSFKLAAKRRGNLKILLLWVFLFGLNAFFGSLLAGCVVQGGFWYAIKWSVGSYGAVWGIAVLLGLLQVAAGMFLAPVFLEACPSATLRQFHYRRKMLALTLVLPWLLGTLLLAALKFPDLQWYEALQFATLLLFLVPAYFQNLRNPFGVKIQGTHRTRLSALGIGLCFLAALAFRMLLQNGMVFG